MSNYDKLVEALEGIAADKYTSGNAGETAAAAESWYAARARKALPLARQLIEENERLVGHNAQYSKALDKAMEENERLKDTTTDRVMNIQLMDEVDRLQSRLSTAERERSRLLQAKVGLRQELSETKIRAQRAEAVVDTAKDAERRLSVIEQYLKAGRDPELVLGMIQEAHYPLTNAIRRCEEGR